jgi:hypothetical protein
VTRRALVITSLAAVTAAGAIAAAESRYRWRRQAVPPVLAEGVEALRGDGWHMRAWHPARCRDTNPHIHLRSPGGMVFVLYESGRLRLPREIALAAMAAARDGQDVIAGRDGGRPSRAHAQECRWC